MGRRFGIGMLGIGMLGIGSFGTVDVTSCALGRGFDVTREGSAPDGLPSPSGEIVRRGERFERVFERTGPVRDGSVNAPAVAPDGSIYFSDLAPGENPSRLLRFEPASGKTEAVLQSSRVSSGMEFAPDGTLVICEEAHRGERRVSRIDVESGQRRTLADGIAGQRSGPPIDVAIDAKGRVYVSDSGSVEPESRKLTRRSVARIERGGVVEVLSDFEAPHGLAFAPDGKTLYVADAITGTDRSDPATPSAKPGAMKVYAYPIDPSTGSVDGPRRTLFDFVSRPGAGGLTVDEDGRVYIALRDPARPGVLVLSPSGAELGFLPTGRPGAGTGLPSDCVFGRGVESDRLYVTVDSSLVRIRLAVHGAHLVTDEQRKLLRVFRDEFVEVPAGSFAMGPAEGPPGGDKAGGAARRVTFERAFRVAKYEVPQNLWAVVMGRNPSRWKGPRNSVEKLTFSDAERFAHVATQLMRRGGLIAGTERVRLPTEAEWEYAARAGTETAYSFGDDVSHLDAYAWHKGNAAGNDPPVGAKKPNSWGLYDIHGYLWEWCTPDPSSGAGESERALRGGSWKDPCAQVDVALSPRRAREYERRRRRASVCARDRTDVIGVGGIERVTGARPRRLLRQTSRHSAW